MMCIKKLKKLTYVLWVPAILASLIFLAEGAHGMDLLAARIYTLEDQNKKLETELLQQKEEIQRMEVKLRSEIGGAGDTPIPEHVKKLRDVIKADADTLEAALGSLNENLNDIPGPNLVSKVEALKETLKGTQEEKESSEKTYQKVHSILGEIKKVTGGSGTNTPILPRVQKLHDKNQTVKMLEKELDDFPGNGIEDKVVSLKEALVAAQKEKENLQAEKENSIQQYVEMQYQIAELRIEMGGGGGDTPPVTRVRTLSNSLKKDTNSLKAAVNALTQKLNSVPGEDCADKVDGLITTLALTQGILNILEQKLDGIPGDGLIQKLEVLMAEREVTKEMLGNMQETITNKEEAYNDLRIELLRAQHEVSYLDEELSKAQVTHSEKKEQLNRVLDIQFNRRGPINCSLPTQMKETNSTK